MFVVLSAKVQRIEDINNYAKNIEESKNKLMKSLSFEIIGGSPPGGSPPNCL